MSEEPTIRQSNSGAADATQGRRLRYRAGRGGPDPLRPPQDFSALLQLLGSKVMNGESVYQAILTVLRRGVQGHSGLDDFLEKTRSELREARNQGNPELISLKVSETIAVALRLEREELARDYSDDAVVLLLELATLPTEGARCLSALWNYKWRSVRARQVFVHMRDDLSTEIVTAHVHFADTLVNNTSSTTAIIDLVNDLNRVMRSALEGKEADTAFHNFMDRHGRLFTPRPATLDELAGMVARNMAATERLLASCPDPDRQQLESLVDVVLSEANLDFEVSELRSLMRRVRPDLERERAAGIDAAENFAGYLEAMLNVEKISDLERLERQILDAIDTCDLYVIDAELLGRALPGADAETLRLLRTLERDLRQREYLVGKDVDLQFTARAMRHLSTGVLQSIFRGIPKVVGVPRIPTESMLTPFMSGTSRQWTFGDELPIDGVRTVQNALIRAQRPIALDVSDFVVAEREVQNGAEIVLCVDLSFSMVQDGLWEEMKRTALALGAYIEICRQRDRLTIIGFDREARYLSARELFEVSPRWVQGSNLHHALVLAERHLRKQAGRVPVVIVITDGEPTAHTTASGDMFFRWPTTAETVNRTVRACAALRHLGANVNIMMLGSDDGLRRFAAAMAHQAAARLFEADRSSLGGWVLQRYVSERRGRR